MYMHVNGDISPGWGSSSVLTDWRVQFCAFYQCYRRGRGNIKLQRRCCIYCALTFRQLVIQCSLYKLIMPLSDTRTALCISRLQKSRTSFYTTTNAQWHGASRPPCILGSPACKKSIFYSTWKGYSEFEVKIIAEPGSTILSWGMLMYSGSTEDRDLSPKELGVSLQVCTERHMLGNNRVAF